MSTLTNLWSKAQSYLTKFYTWSPFVSGVLVGYFGKHLIYLAIIFVFKVVKFL